MLFRSKLLGGWDVLRSLHSHPDVVKVVAYYRLQNILHTDISQFALVCILAMQHILALVDLVDQFVLLFSSLKTKTPS